MPSRDTLTALVQRLIQTVGAPSALELVGTIPGLAVDEQGQVLVYDHARAMDTARLLIELYNTLVSESGSPAGLPHAAPPVRDSTPAEAVTRLLIVDDHALVREGLASLIQAQPDFEVVGQAGSAREAISLARDLRPELILMDFTLPDGTGDEAARMILSTLPDSRIVFLTVHDDDERLFAAIAAGAAGYLLKSVRSADLINRLRDVVRGEVVLSPTIGRRIFEKLARQQPVKTPAPVAPTELSEREVEILCLIVQGNTNRQIAAMLHLSVRTVEYHRANLTDKLGLRSRVDLVRYAVDNGLLDRF